MLGCRECGLRYSSGRLRLRVAVHQKLLKRVSKMDLEMTVVDAFTDSVFSGNPAAVIITDTWLSGDLMQSIAAENNLSETAFLVLDGTSTYQIQWFRVQRATKLDRHKTYLLERIEGAKPHCRPQNCRA